MAQERFYDRFEKLLIARKMQKTDIAKICGISKNGISTWNVTNTIPRADVAIKIAQALNVSVEYLILGEVPNIEKKDDSLVYRVNMLSDAHKSLITTILDALEKLSL